MSTSLSLWLLPKVENGKGVATFYVHRESVTGIRYHEKFQ